jgi:cobalt-zinc-cadmium efflux system protein
LAQGRNVFSAHICVKDLGREGQRVLREAHGLLKSEFGVFFSTLQLEERCLEEEEQEVSIDITRSPGSGRQSGDHDR